MRILVHALIFCGVYLTVAYSLGALIEHLNVPLEEPGTKRKKADDYRREKDGIDLVFVGSSRVYRQYDPRLFEREAAKLELELTAYNLGLPGMRFLESLAFVNWILDQDAQRLRWILFELQSPEPLAQEALRFTRRNIRWHTPRLTRLAAERSLAARSAQRKRSNEFWGHVGQGLLHLSNVDTGLSFFRSLWGWQESPLATTAGGFLPLDEDKQRDVRRRREVYEEARARNPNFLAEKAKNHALARGLLAPPDPPAWMKAELHRLVAAAEERGVEILFLISPPADHNYLDLSRIREDRSLPRTFAYDPIKYPQLYYENSLRADLQHLNHEGAKKLTSLLARRFVRHVQRKDD